MKHKILAAALGCGAGLLLMRTSPLWLLPALGCLAWLAVLALRADQASETDPLTALGNLRRLERRRGHFEKADHLAVGYFDMDRLKQTNDTRGHATGDTLLRAAAEALTQTAGKRGLVCRIGGDEFLLLSDEAGADELARRWETAAGSRGIQVSCGWAEGPGKELDALIKQAEAAMYHCK